MGYDDYLDSLPVEIASLQRAFDLNRHAWQMRQHGMKLKVIGKHIGCSVERARQRINKYHHYLRLHHHSPLELWLMRDPRFRWDCQTLIGMRGRKYPKERPLVMAALQQMTELRYPPASYYRPTHRPLNLYLPNSFPRTNT